MQRSSFIFNFLKISLQSHDFSLQTLHRMDVISSYYYQKTCRPSSISKINENKNLKYNTLKYVVLTYYHKFSHIICYIIYTVYQKIAQFYLINLTGSFFKKNATNIEEENYFLLSRNTYTFLDWISYLGKGPNHVKFYYWSI